MEQNLNLIVSKPWFGMEASREKSEEYREITAYWVKRLLTSPLGRNHVANQAEQIVAAIRTSGLAAAMAEYKVMPVAFDKVIIANGYHRGRLTFTAQFRGLTVGTGRPEWGAPEYATFIIKL